MHIVLMSMLARSSEQCSAQEFLQLLNLIQANETGLIKAKNLIIMSFVILISHVFLNTLKSN